MKVFNIYRLFARAAVFNVLRQPELMKVANHGRATRHSNLYILPRANTVRFQRQSQYVGIKLINAMLKDDIEFEVINRNRIMKLIKKWIGETDIHELEELMFG